MLKTASIQGSILFTTSLTAEEDQLSADCMWPSGLLRQSSHHLRIGKPLQLMNQPLLHTSRSQLLAFMTSCRATNADLLSCSVKLLPEYRYSILELRWESCIAIARIAELISLRVLNQNFKGS